jgi:hypothetical protein
MTQSEWSPEKLRDLARQARTQARYCMPVAAAALKAIAVRYDAQADELERGRL